MGKLLLIAGGLLVVVGLLLTLGGKLPLRLGRLPGDIVWHGERTTFYFPIVTCIVVSIVLTLLFWLVSLLKR